MREQGWMRADPAPQDGKNIIIKKIQANARTPVFLGGARGILPSCLRKQMCICVTWDGRKAEAAWTVYGSEDMLWWTHKGVLGLFGAGGSWAPLHYKVGGRGLQLQESQPREEPEQPGRCWRPGW